MSSALQWDVFCRVVDNYGDIGVCLRLARDLAQRGQLVRLWVDDAAALHWMAADGLPAGLRVRPWAEAEHEAQPGDVVVETFGCELPAAFVQRMAARPKPPCWINLEYLSAEPYVERSHSLRSPQLAGPGRGLDKWFFYPGFSARTGGLLREPGLLQAQAAFDAPAWLAARGWQPRDGERVVSVFCYANNAWPQLLASLAEAPTLLLLCPGAARQQVPELAARHAQLRCIPLPYLSQADYDRLLWSCELNLVRGEDSLVRALWAGRPLLWHIYPQDDGAHGPKLEAFMDQYLAHADADWAGPMRQLWRAWNALTPWTPATGRDCLTRLKLGRQQALRWREEMSKAADLCSQLMGFVAESG
ncbi:elongation factor P maturation arginine rhamnosyltransferase EarP [Paucibacter soli]|uniref:elongation factor P maturation arginine rhamnosyltransferase EarP n=1 Tax=Paucibacter soli TaxID=3133433 RepID=UPI0030A546A7